MLFIVTAALAFSAPKSNLPALATPKSNLLALRGGGIVSTDVLYNTQAGLIMLTGLQGWVAPVNTLEMYGVKDATDGESTWVRVVSGMNIVLAVTMVAAQTGLDTAVTTCALAFASAIAYNVPIFEKFGVDKSQLVFFIVLMGAIGELSRRGIMPANWAFNVLVPFFLIGMSVIDRLAPEKIMEAYKMPKPTALMNSLFMNFSLTKMAIGAFLLTIKLTGKTGLGLAAMSAALLVNVGITALNKEADVDKAGLIFWGVMQAAIGGLSFLNEK
jgi:hypothetical protein